LGVPKEFVRVTIRSGHGSTGRRLQTKELATLSENLWEVDYEVEMPSEQASSVSIAAQAISHDTSGLREQLQVQLIAEGVDQAAIQDDLVMFGFTAELLYSKQPVSPSVETPGPSQGFPLPAVIGGVVGASVGLSCVAMCLYLSVRRRRQAFDDERTPFSNADEGLTPRFSV